MVVSTALSLLTLVTTQHAPGKRLNDVVVAADLAIALDQAALLPDALVDAREGHLSASPARPSGTA